jgi:hypothetical protein
MKAVSHGAGPTRLIPTVVGASKPSGSVVIVPVVAPEAVWTASVP